MKSGNGMTDESACVLYEYKAGIRHKYAMPFIVGCLVSLLFWFGAFHLWRSLCRGAAPDSSAGTIVALVVTLLPCALLWFQITRRPRSFRLIRKTEGLFVVRRSGAAVRLTSTRAEVREFLFSKESFGECRVPALNRRGTIHLHFYDVGEAASFSGALGRAGASGGHPRRGAVAP